MPDPTDYRALREAASRATPGLASPWRSRMLAAWRISLRSVGFVGELVLIEDMCAADDAMPTAPVHGASPIQNKRASIVEYGEQSGSSATLDMKQGAMPSSAGQSLRSIASNSARDSAGSGKAMSLGMSFSRSQPPAVDAANTAQPKSMSAVRLQTLADLITSSLESGVESIGLRISSSVADDAIVCELEADRAYLALLSPEVVLRLVQRAELADLLEAGNKAARESALKTMRETDARLAQERLDSLGETP